MKTSAKRHNRQVNTKRIEENGVLANQNKRFEKNDTERTHAKGSSGFHTLGIIKKMADHMQTQLNIVHIVVMSLSSPLYHLSSYFH